MPLIDFKTDLKSLRYGSDKPNGGSSTQPYVQFPIPDSGNQTVSNATMAFFNSYYETNRTSLDFPIRGGRVVEVAGNTYTTPSNAIDLTRIKNFLEDAPRGTVFIQKQRGLQLTNPNTQVPNTFQNTGGLFNINNQVLPTTRTYNPANTLAQIAVEGTGAHFNRHGVNPTIYESPQTTYGYIVANAPTAQNRLAILAALKLRDTGTFQFDVDDVLDAGFSLQNVNILGISPTQGQILNYQGGPGSVYGIGSTIIRRATSTIPDKVYSKSAFTYEQIAAQSTRAGNSPYRAQTQDFRDQLDPQVVARSLYGVYSQEARLNVGNPGENIYPKIAYNTVIDPAIDQLNKQNLFYYNSTNETPWEAGGSDTNDIIKFGFECISNDNPNNAVALIFRAFLDGAIQDSNTAEYSSFRYLGRGETFRAYQGVDRSVGFAFKILVQTRSEMRPLYRKLNHLISQVYPDYSPQSNFMRGSVVKLTIGDYLYRVPGFLESVNVTLDTNVGWEILLDEYEEGPEVAQAPFVVTVSCAFKPIMDILPRRETYEDPVVPLIMNRDNFLTTEIDNKGVPGAVLPKQGIIPTRETLTAPNAPQTFTGSPIPNLQPNPKAPPPPVTNAGGGNSRTARRGVKKTATTKPASKILIDLDAVNRRSVIQDNTSFNPANAGGTSKGGTQ